MNANETLKRLETLAPQFTEITEQVLFGQVWQSEVLNPRERSLITLAALTALNRVEQLPFHIELAQRNGLTTAEIAEAMTHLAFYGGWPAAVSALNQLAQLQD